VILISNHLFGDFNDFAYLEIKIICLLVLNCVYTLQLITGPLCCCGTSTSAFVVNVDARRPADTPFHRRWPRFPRGCGADIEQPVEISDIVIFTGCQLDISWRQNCSSEVFLISTALPTIVS